jgi:hypothetical protein
MSVPVGYRVGVAGEYTIEITNVKSFIEPVSVYLEDLVTGEMIEIIGESSYSFFANPEDDIIRFELHFMTVAGLENQVEKSDVYIYSSANHVMVKNYSTNYGGTITVYDITGNEILSSKLDNKPLNEISLSVHSGYYVVKVVTDSEVYSQKVFIK